MEVLDCLIEHQAMKTYWGSGGVAPRILNLGTRWRWSASLSGRFTLWYSLDRSRSGSRGEEKKNPFIAPPGTEPWSCSLQPSYYTD
jgi:hypothetical protein